MSTYCYLCPECREEWSFDERTQPFCDECQVEMRRDWKAEAVYLCRVPGGGRD